MRVIDGSLRENGSPESTAHASKPRARNATGTQIIVARRDGRGFTAIPGDAAGGAVVAAGGGAGGAATANPHLGQNCDPGGNAVLQFQQSSAIWLSEGRIRSHFATLLPAGPILFTLNSASDEKSRSSPRSGRTGRLRHDNAESN